MKPPADWLRPAWGIANVGALMTTRHGGVSRPPFDTLNFGDAAGDDAAAVVENQRRLARAIGATPVWLDQVHGIEVARLTAADARPDAARRTADASVTTESGIACAVWVADCLPVLFTAPDGRAVAAAHAGWRGLAAGVLEATLARLCDVASCAPAEVAAWLGVGIGPTRFEVGADVLAAFGIAGFGDTQRFVACGHSKWLADLPGLAHDRLQAAGVRAISGGAGCSVSEPSRFFSFRRDRATGRMAAVVWIDRAGR